jgi:glucose-6-phosphate-specific signal transduction histidine kinase
MPTIIQILSIAVGSLLSILLTITINEIRGMRKDLKESALELKTINDRLIVLETEHRGNWCQYRRAGDSI